MSEGNCKRQLPTIHANAIVGIGSEPIQHESIGLVESGDYILNGYHSTKDTTEEQTKLSKDGVCVLFLFHDYIQQGNKHNTEEKEEKNKP